jgi:hypothetical protein
MRVSVRNDILTLGEAAGVLPASFDSSPGRSSTRYVEGKPQIGIEPEAAVRAAD